MSNGRACPHCQQLPDGPELGSGASTASEQRYRLLVQSVRDYAVFMVDLEEKILTWNPGAEQLHGFSERDAVGLQSAVLYAPEDRATGTPGRLFAAASARGSVQDEGWRLRKDGSRFWGEEVITAVRDASGQLVGYSKVTRDLTVRRQAEEALRQSEERLRLMVGSVRDYAIFMLDAGGHVQSWNTGAELAKGYKAQEIIGKHISTFYTPEDQAAGRPQQLLQQAAKEGRVEDEGWRVRKGGARFWADVVLTALFDSTGKLCGFTKVTRDLSDKRQAEDALRLSETRFKMLVQSVKDYAIFMLDPQGRIATWNLGAERINGYSAEEVIGQHFSIFYSREEAASGKCERELEEAAAAGKFEEEGWRSRKDGSRYWASVVIHPLRSGDGRLLGFAKVTRDLTEQKAADAERVRLAQAQEAIRMRDEFLSIASHELKTPLTAIQLQLQGLVHQAKGADEKLRKRLERAYLSGERLSDLVETLLDVSRIATGKFTLFFSKFDLAQTAQEVVERYREQAERDGCALTLHAESSVLGEWDKVRVEQILTNLLANSLKYAAGTPVQVQVEKKGESAVLSVADQGPGIPSSEWSRIFGRFERATSMRHYGGMGLGLYVTRQIVDAHGGTIAIEQVQPQGVRFVVTLPCVPTKVAVSPREATESSP